MYRIRFFFTILQCLLRPVRPLSASHTLRRRALPLIDTDVSRMFTHSYAQFMALARWYLLFGSTFRAASIKHKWVPITTAEIITYRRSIKAFQAFEISTRIVYWNDERFYVEHRFIADDKLCLRAVVEGMVRGPKGVLTPDEVFKEAGFNDDLPIVSQALMSEINGLAKSAKLTQAL